MILALVAFWGNLLAALLYGVMAVFQLRHWHGDSLNRPLVGAFAVMSVWAIFLAMLPGYAMLPQLAEAARNIAFLAFMYGIMQNAEGGGQPALKAVYGSVAAVVGLQIVIGGVIGEYRDAVAELGKTPALVIGGKSMGGRVASMAADQLLQEEKIAGLLCLGYPFHPPAKPTQLRTAHLADLRTPTLICQGTRDEFGTRDEVEGYNLSDRIELLWLEDGDHDLSRASRFRVTPPPIISLPSLRPSPTGAGGSRVDRR